MSSRRTVRQLVVAVLVGVLVGGGLMAVTPAGAEVSSALATNWKKIWKKEIRPRADKRYYTKKQSDGKYQPKGSYETAGSGYTKAETYSKAEADAKYQPKGNYALNGSSYTKAESDAKYAPTTTVVRGTSIQAVTAAAAGANAGDDISFGVTLSAAPTVHYIPFGAAAPDGCSGTPALPNASPGNLCVFEVAAVNKGTNAVLTPTGAPGATQTGAVLFGTSAAAGQFVVTTSWAVRPLALAPAGARGATGTPSGPSVFGD